MQAVTRLLEQLILVAEQALLSPRVYCGEADLQALREQIADAVKTPAEGERIIHHSNLLLADVLLLLDRARSGGNDEQVRRMRQLVGVMLPDVREDLARALIVTHATRPTP